MLSKKIRLKKTKDFEIILKKGSYSTTILWTLKWFRNTLQHPRFGFIVSNKISKKATQRNSIKRKLRHLVYKNIKKFWNPVDFLFIAKSSVKDVSFKEMDKVLEEQIKQINSHPLKKI